MCQNQILHQFHRYQLMTEIRPRIRNENSKSTLDLVTESAVGACGPL